MPSHLKIDILYDCMLNNIDLKNLDLWIRDNPYVNPNKFYTRRDHFNEIIRENINKYPEFNRIITNSINKKRIYGLFDITNNVYRFAVTDTTNFINYDFLLMSILKTLNLKHDFIKIKFGKSKLEINNNRWNNIYKHILQIIQRKSFCSRLHDFIKKLIK